MNVFTSTVNTAANGVLSLFVLLEQCRRLQYGVRRAADLPVRSQVPLRGIYIH